MDKPIYPLSELKEEIDLPKVYDPQELENLIYGLSLDIDPEGFKSRYPFPANNEHGLRQILTEDNRSRRLKRWPLISLQDFKFYVTLLKQELLAYNGKDASQTTGNSSIIDDPELPILNSITNGFNVTNLYRDFSALKPILTKYKNQLVVAGGAILRTILDINKSDCDIFFYGVSEQEATNILFDCITMIVGIAMHKRQTSGEQIKIKVEHKLYITNVLLIKENEKEVYQFIHRVYPTKDSIIGGFDLGPSMVLFDGEQVYSTPLGAYCIAKRCIIVDTSRRSISFEQRIYKLSTFNFGVIFPGISLETSKKSFEDLKGDGTQELRKMADLIRKLGYKIYMDYEIFDREPSYKQVLTKNKMIDLGMIRFNEHYQLTYPRPLYATDDDLPKSLLKHYSDYGSVANGVTLTHNNEIYINGAMLRTENLEGVSTSVTFPMNVNLNPQVIFETLIRLFTVPEVTYDVGDYKLRTYKFLMKNRDRKTAYCYPLRNLRRETTKFAEFALKVRKLEDQNSALDYIKSVVDYLAKRMVNNAKLCEENLKGVKWMTQAVGVQWTSSINPIIENPRDYYGKYYTQFWIGMPCEIETTLRLFRRRPGNYFNSMPKDLFNTILNYVSRAYLYNVSYVMRGVAPPMTKFINQIPPYKNDNSNPYNFMYLNSGGTFSDYDYPTIPAKIIGEAESPPIPRVQMYPFPGIPIPNIQEPAPSLFRQQDPSLTNILNQFNAGPPLPDFLIPPPTMNFSPEVSSEDEE